MSLPPSWNPSATFLPFTKQGLNPFLLPTPHSCVPQTSPTPKSCSISFVHCLLWYLCLASHSPSPQATLCICHPLLILRKQHSLHSRPPQLWHLPLRRGTPCTLAAEKTELWAQNQQSWGHAPKTLAASQPLLGEDTLHISLILWTRWHVDHGRGGGPKPWTTRQKGCWVALPVFRSKWHLPGCSLN